MIVIFLLLCEEILFHNEAINVVFMVWFGNVKTGLPARLPLAVALPNEGCEKKFILYIISEKIDKIDISD